MSLSKEPCVIDPSLTGLPIDDSHQKSERKRLEMICDYINTRNLTPKSFITKFLTSIEHPMPERRRLWNTERGLNSTMDVVKAIKGLLMNSEKGRVEWGAFISDQVCRVL